MKKSYDLTQGPILNRLLLVAIPIMGTQFIQMAYNLTDMFWVSRLGVDAVAATGAAGMYMWLSMAFMLLGRMGAEIGVSQSLGAGNREAAKKFSQMAILINCAAGILFSCAMVFYSKFFIGFFNIREVNVAENAARYLSIVGISSAPFFIASAITGTFTGSGNSRLPFIIHATGLGINIILDPILIFPIGMGIAGAAVATVISQTVVCTLFIAAIHFHKARPFERFTLFTKPDWPRARQILKWSVPIALESFLFTMLTMTVTRFITSFGDKALAVSRIGSQIESLSWLIGGGFASAVTAFTGQNFGALKWTRIRQCYRLSAGVMTLWGALVSLLMLALGRQLFMIFLDDLEVLVIGAEYMRILALCQIPMCIEAISSSIFRGIGETSKPSIVSITCNAARVPLAYFLSITSLGLNGIWIGITLGSCLRGVWMLAWLLIRKRKLPFIDGQRLEKDSPQPA